MKNVLFKLTKKMERREIQRTDMLQVMYEEAVSSGHSRKCDKKTGYLVNIIRKIKECIEVRQANGRPES